MSLASLFSALGGLQAKPDYTPNYQGGDQDTIAPQSPIPTTPPPPQMAARTTGGIKGYLSDMFYQMGEAGKRSIGLMTDAEKQQLQFKNQMEQQRTQADIADKQAEAEYRKSQTAMNAPMPVLDPREAEALGVNVGDMISPATKLALQKAQLQYRGKLAQANATVSAAAMRAMAINQRVTMRAAYMPDGTLSVGLYDRLGNFQGYADHAAIPAEYMEKIKQGQELKFDDKGNLYTIPVTSTSKPLVPPPPQPNKLIDTAPKAQPPQGNVNTAPPPAPSPATLKGSLTAGANRQASPVSNAKPVTAGGEPFKGPAAADTGYYVDPQTNQMQFGSRAEAAGNDFTKVNAAQMRKDQSIVNNVADIQRKFGDYAETFDHPIDQADKVAISYLMDHDIGAGLAAKGISLNVLPGYIQSQLKAAGINKLSKEGMDRYILYNQAKESLAYLQQAKTGASRFTDAINQLHFDQLAPPIADPEFANRAHSLFQQNIDYVAHGLPHFKNIKDTQETVKAAQDARRAQTAAIQNNQQNPQQYIDRQSQPAEPPRPAHVPANYVYKLNGPKGRGWYKP